MGFLLEVTVENFRKDVVPSILESLERFGPELQVTVAAMVLLLLDLVVSRRGSKHLAWLAIFACAYPAVSVLSAHEAEEASLFRGMLATDSYATFFKLFFLLGAIPVILLSSIARELEGRRMGEYYAILLATVLAGMLMASSTHFLMVILSLELLSISSYVLVGFHRRQRASSEASLKYIIYGSVAAALMIYGLSLLYGLTGSGEVLIVGERVAEILRGDTGLWGAKFTVIVALVMTFLGLAYKMATIPMHFWCPDVYEGAPTPITAFLSVASKAAGFALCLRFFSSFFAGVPALEQSYWLTVMIVVAIATMTLGNLAALWQENLKRLFAYSSIAHAGYMMMGIVLPAVSDGGGETFLGGLGGIQLVTFYLLAYLAMNLGAFAVVIAIENRTGSVNMADYNGLGWRAPFLGVALTIFLFSLIGIPPTAGFVGKFQLFMGVLEQAGEIGASSRPVATLYYILAVAAVVNTAISVYYYARIIRNMYLTRIDEGAARMRIPFLGNAVVAAMLFLTFFLFFYADTILERTLDLGLFVNAGSGH